MSGKDFRPPAIRISPAKNQGAGETGTAETIAGKSDSSFRVFPFS
jgi:hypothetical protein